METKDLPKLNGVHSEIINDYLRLSRYQQTQRLKSINHAFNDIVSIKLSEEGIFTSDEVRVIIAELQENVITDVQTELTDSAHTNVLLTQQLLSEAQEWHLTLSANISELENREKLNIIKEYEEDMTKSPEKMSITLSKSRLEPVFPMTDEEKSIAGILKSEIASLSAEREILKKKIEDLEELAKAALVSNAELAKSNENNDFILLKDLEKAHFEIDRLKAKLEAATEKDAEKQVIQDSLEVMSKELERSKIEAKIDEENLRKDLEAREEKLRKVQSNLILAEKELDKKFQATSAYMNMKKILVQKNELIKDLRIKVSKFEKSKSCDEEDDEEEDENDQMTNDD